MEYPNMMAIYKSFLEFSFKIIYIIKTLFTQEKLDIKESFCFLFFFSDYYY